MQSDIAVSIVLYNNTIEQYGPLVETILCCSRVSKLWLVDHSEWPLSAPVQDARIVHVHNPLNPGFGAGHNQAMRESLTSERYHVVVNPDIRMESDLLSRLAGYLDAHPEVGLVMPTILDSSGRVANQGRLLPHPWDLVGRRWFPRVWERNRARYEPSSPQPRNLPNLSGAFLFFRCGALAVSGLFDERYFLYCEDVDLVRRVHQNHRTEVLPQWTAFHEHQQASYKDWRMTLVHGFSAIQYFTKWGWFHDPQRDEFNRRAQSE